MYKVFCDTGVTVAMAKLYSVFAAQSELSSNS